MTVSVQTLAALAMDVYNRDSGQGYVYEKPVPNIDGFVPQVGQSLPGNENNFFANYYTNGDTIVIAYRGADEGASEIAGDAISVATGHPNQQVYDALKYYDDVAHSKVVPDFASLIRATVLLPER